MENKQGRVTGSKGRNGTHLSNIFIEHLLYTRRYAGCWTHAESQTDIVSALMKLI